MLKPLVDPLFLLYQDWCTFCFLICILIRFNCENSQVTFLANHCSHWVASKPLVIPGSSMPWYQDQYTVSVEVRLGYHTLKYTVGDTCTPTTRCD